MSEKAWLRILNSNGKDYYQVVFGYKKDSQYLLGSDRYIEITAAEAALSIDKLTRLYKAEKGEAEQRRAAAEAASARQAEAKEKLGDLVERISRIIRESTQLGEVESAKVFYKKITGEDWTG